MRMRIEPLHESIGQFFRGDFIFDVPKYQRNYAWEGPEIEDFIKDLKRCYDMRTTKEPIPHFFGGIVSIEERLPGGRYSEVHIIDGQQRLVTFVLLVANIVLLYKAIEKEIDEELAETPDESSERELAGSRELVKKRVSELTRKYLKLDYEVNREIVKTDRLTVSEPDRQFFRDLIYEHPSATDIEESRESHKRLERAFEEIRDFLEGIIDFPSTVDKLDALKRIEEILDEDFTLIHMITETKDVAYRLFQVLNDRGTQLTVGDLLRARTLEMLDPPPYSEPQHVVKRAWDDIIADPPGQTRSFLKWYYASVHGKRPRNATLFDDFLEAFFPQDSSAGYVVSSSEEAEEVSRAVVELQKGVHVLRTLVDGDWPYPHKAPVKKWHRNRLNLLVLKLKHTNCMPLLLAAAEHLDHKNFAEIVQLVERFAFRYKVICNQHISPLTRTYNREAQAIRALETAPYRVRRLRDELRSLQAERAPDSVFRSHLTELTYKPRGGNRPLKYLLMTLEHYARWYGEGAQSEPECKNDTRVFDFANTTIEHIYPQGADPPEPDLEELVHELGNLTFLGPDDNQAMANEEFAEKKQFFEESSVLLNRKMAENDTWDGAAVEARQERLIKMALDVFSV